jgi:FOG: Glucan-binding domain (YG repeat)
MIINKLKKTLTLSIALVAMLAMTPTIQAHAEWRQDNAGWWYTNGSSYDTGWNNIGGKWYYFDNSGYMKTGWVQDGGLWYYLYPDGSMAHDTIVGNSYLSSTGAWIDTSKVNVSTENQGISVTYPSNWTKKTVSGVEGYYLDDKGTNINLVSESMQGYSIDQYSKASDEAIKKYLNVDTISSKSGVVNNKNVRITLYHRTLNGKDIEVYQTFFYNNNTAYIFTLTGLAPIADENIDAYTKMLGTVQFK